MLQCSQIDANSLARGYLTQIAVDRCTLSRPEAELNAVRHLIAIKAFHHHFNQKVIRVEVALDQHDRVCKIVIEGVNCQILMMSLCTMIRRSPLCLQDVEDLLSYQYSTSECVEIYHREPSEQLAKL